MANIGVHKSNSSSLLIIILIKFVNMVLTNQDFIKLYVLCSLSLWPGSYLNRTYAVSVHELLLFRYSIYSLIAFRMTLCLPSNQLRVVLTLPRSNLRNTLIENSMCVL